MEEKYFKLLRLVGGDEALVGEAPAGLVHITPGPGPVGRHPAVECGELVLTLSHPAHQPLRLGQCVQQQGDSHHQRPHVEIGMSRDIIIYLHV